MPFNHLFPPEGLCPPATHTLSELKNAMEEHTILESTVQRCDADHTLHIPMGSVDGLLPPVEAVAPWISGSTRDIAILSRVGKPTCFTVKSIQADEKGAPIAFLSRRMAQEQAMEVFLRDLTPGTVLLCRVTHLESYGAFLDIGCGIIAMLPIEHISISRIAHPRERFREGDRILAAVWSLDRKKRRITMTHRELLGTWMENASHFHAGETVRGIVRSIKEYGSFIELSPNLSGLADVREGLVPGDGVSVFIKSIRPERMKIKLHIIETLPPSEMPEPLHYQTTDGILTHWIYSPPNYEKTPVETDFTKICP